MHADDYYSNDNNTILWQYVDIFLGEENTDELNRKQQLLRPSKYRLLATQIKWLQMSHFIINKIIDSQINSR